MSTYEPGDSCSNKRDQLTTEESVKEEVYRGADCSRFAGGANVSGGAFGTAELARAIPVAVRARSAFARSRFATLVIPTPQLPDGLGLRVSSTHQAYRLTHQST